MHYCCRSNPDEEIRRLEREASQGDTSARYELLRWRARAGDRYAQVHLALHDLSDALNDWANRDGRQILIGNDIPFLSHPAARWRIFPNEHPHDENFYRVSDISIEEVTNDSSSPIYFQLIWEASIFIDPQRLQQLQTQIQDIRLLRPINRVRIHIRLGLGEPLPEDEQAVGGAVIHRASCDWNPELVRAGSTWHSGWYEYRGIIPAVHPYRQILGMIENCLGITTIHGNLWRQMGPTDDLIE